MQCGKPAKAAIGSQLEKLSPEALETSARRLLAPILRQQGEQFARSGHDEQALNKFKQAQASGLDLNPAIEANRLTSSASKLQGILNALQLRIEEATAKFTQAKQYDPELELEPEAEAKRIAAPVLVEMGQGLAKELKIEEAIAKFTQAKQYDPKLELEPEAEAKRIAAPVLIDQGKALLEKEQVLPNDVQQALEAYQTAQVYDPALTITARVTEYSFH